MQLFNDDNAVCSFVSSVYVLPSNVKRSSPNQRLLLAFCVRSLGLGCYAEKSIRFGIVPSKHGDVGPTLLYDVGPTSLPDVGPSPRRIGPTSARRRADEQTTSTRCLAQSCPWVGLTHGLGWVESTTENVLKI